MKRLFIVGLAFVGLFTFVSSGNYDVAETVPIGGSAPKVLAETVPIGGLSVEGDQIA